MGTASKVTHHSRGFQKLSVVAERWYQNSPSNVSALLRLETMEWQWKREGETEHLTHKLRLISLFL